MDGSSSASPVVLAFDLGGTRLKAGLVKDAQIGSLQIAEINDEGRSEHVLQLLCDMGERFLALDAIQAIGISVRGIVDAQQGMILDVNHALSSLIGYPLAATLTQHFGLPTVMENDARMYALGEWLYGAGLGCAHLVCLTLGTGVGSGVILNKRVLRGSRHVAGILGGHLTLQADGPLCSCGNRGCLESLIGTAALTGMALDRLPSCPASTLAPSSLTPQHIFAAASSGDVLACEIVTRFAELLGAGIVSMIHAYDPDRIVIGGGLAHSSALFLPAVQAYVNTHAWSIPRGRVPIVPALLGDGAALVGIAAATRQQDLFW